MAYRRVVDCVKIAGLRQKFLEADRWFAERGHAEGWRVKNATGAAYGIEVTKLHERANSGEKPGDREAAREAAKRERKAQAATKEPPPPDARRIVAEKDAEIADLEEARENVREEVNRARARADVSAGRAGRWKREAKRLWRQLAAAKARMRELGVDFGFGKG